MLPKYWLRPITKHIPKPCLFSVLEKLVPFQLPISNAFTSVPFLGSLIRRIVPVANYKGILPLSNQQLLVWALLDTFDWLSPAYENPQSPRTVRCLRRGWSPRYGGFACRPSCWTGRCLTSSRQLLVALCIA